MMKCKSTIKNNEVTIHQVPGPVFTKGLRLKCGLKVETFVSAKFCLKTIFTKGDLSPRLSNNHSGFLCHVTFLFYSNYTIFDIYPSFNAFYLRNSAVLKWKTLLPHINFQRLL